MPRRLHNITRKQDAIYVLYRLFVWPPSAPQSTLTTQTQPYHQCSFITSPSQKHKNCCIDNGYSLCSVLLKRLKKSILVISAVTLRTFDWVPSTNKNELHHIRDHEFCTKNELWIDSILTCSSWSKETKKKSLDMAQRNG